MHDFGSVQTLPAVLRRAATRFADKPALVGDDRSLSYAELDRCVDALTNRLRAEGAAPGDRIGLAVERGPFALIGSAAIQRAGCAYVPLDIRHPHQRLAHIAAHSGLHVTVSDEAGRRSVQDLALSTIAVDDDDLAPKPVGQPVDSAEGSSAAYVMYTSGSTGVPKGVEVMQANVLALLEDALDLFGYGDDEVWPLQHAHGFDVSVWEMWAGIASGSTLVSSGDFVDVELLAESMLRHRATQLHIVPSVFNHLAEVVAEAGLEIPLRQVVFCGEAVNRRAIEIWEHSQAGLIPAWVNAYGITETTVYNTYHRMTPQDVREHRGTTPIGRAYRTSPAIIVDENLHTVALGEQGEIVIGGRQVARGYLHDPTRTMEQFVAIPGRAGRWYRTGDLGVCDTGGDLHYAGRMDDQVKVRGFRIELGEIDHAMRALPWVRDAAAVLQGSTRGEVAITAFVVPSAQDHPIDASLTAELRNSLRDRLPEYMLPSRVIPLERLPVNGNGKTDRRALGSMAAGSGGGPAQPAR